MSTFKVGAVYKRATTNKHGERLVRCVYSSDGYVVLRNLKDDSEFFDVLHPSNYMASYLYKEIPILEENE